MLRLDTENVINRSCFDKAPFELYFNKVFYTEDSNKINEKKDDVYNLVLKKTLPSETIVIKLNSHLKNTTKFFRISFTCQKFD